MGECEKRRRKEDPRRDRRFRKRGRRRGCCRGNENRRRRATNQEATIRLNFSLSNRENEQAGRVSEKIVHANSHQRHDNDNEMQTVGGAELREKYSGVFSGEP